MDHGSSAAADRTACESLVTTSMRQAAATAKMRSRPRCGPCRALSLAADMKAALLYDQPGAGNSVQDSASLGIKPTALYSESRCSEGARYGALVRALSRKPSKSSERMRHSRPSLSAGSVPHRSHP